MSDFADTFKQLWVPQLTELCIAHGSSIAHGLESFSIAFGSVMRVAHDRGASFLDDPFRLDLEDWILKTLASEAAKWEAKLNSMGA